jgi:hypothetical protein
MNGTAIAIAEFLIHLCRLYLLAGVIFAVPFVLFGIQRVDSSAQWGNIGFWSIVNGVGFRIVIIPGLAIFWPLFVVRLIRGKGKPLERNSHRLLAKQSEAW